MLRIDVRPLPPYTGPEIMETITTEAANAAVKKLARRIQKKMGSLACEKHPNTPSTLRLIADKELLLKVDKSSFCCREFAKAVPVETRL
jgi:hypothetical protein